MMKKMGRFFGMRSGAMSTSSGATSRLNVLRQGHAMRVIFFYPGEEGTYVDNAEVTLFDNGIIHIKSNQEETTTHLQNCEILWRFETEADERVSKVRLLKPNRELSRESRPSETPEMPEMPDMKGSNDLGPHPDPVL